MSIQVGDNIPSVTLKVLTEDGLSPLNTGEYFAGRKVVLFSVPGAFTPTCSKTHMPEFVADAGNLKARGVDAVACLAVNDPFVMAAWAQVQGAADSIDMLPDGNGEFTAALGLGVDISGAGLGTRSKRFAMIVDNGVVQSLDIEPGKGVTVSGAPACMARLG